MGKIIELSAIYSQSIPKSEPGCDSKAVESFWHQRMSDAVNLMKGLKYSGQRIALELSDQAGS